MFPSYQRRCTFLNSEQLSSSKVVPKKLASLAFQKKGLNRWFKRTSSSEEGSTMPLELPPPPAKTTSPDDSRKLLTTFQGPLALVELPPIPIAIACLPPPVWMSPT